MPHDARGRELKAGDTVHLTATVLTVYQTALQDVCNVELQIVGQASYQPRLNCSAGLCEKVSE
jgi:hypothetical protein